MANDKIWTAKSGTKPPSDPDMGSAPPAPKPRPAPKSNDKGAPIVYKGDVPVDEPTDDSSAKPKGFAVGGSIPSIQVGTPRMDSMPVMRPGTGRMGLPQRPGVMNRMAKGGSVGNASKRADGCAAKGKTKGKVV